MSKEPDHGQQEIREKGMQELSDIELIEGKRSEKGFLLRPQPSNDPNDPLVCMGKFGQRYADSLT
jgi:hypothetical protein